MMLLLLLLLLLEVAIESENTNGGLFIEWKREGEKELRL